MNNLLYGKVRPTIERIDLAKFGILDDISLAISREDQIIPEISGNKFRKLKYNILEAHRANKTTLLTFGGAFSNHLAATAVCGKRFGFSTVGVVRGEENKGNITSNPTLSFCQKMGMKLLFLSRSEYRKKEASSFLYYLKNRFPEAYVLPEGGTNTLAVKGCTEILDTDTTTFDVICVSVGTGGTLAGIVEASLPHQTIVGFSALKGTFQKEVVQRYTQKDNYKIIDNYAFGGYAKIDMQLVRFINTFKSKTGIPLDPVYTGKMMSGIFDMLRNSEFPKNTRIFAVHTGGLQGIPGMNQQLRNKKLPEIK